MEGGRNRHRNSPRRMSDTNDAWERGANRNMWFYEEQITEQTKNDYFQQGVAISCVISKSPTVATSSFAYGIRRFTLVLTWRGL